MARLDFVMKKFITPEQFLEQVDLDAEVVPMESPYEIGVKVGRFFCVCDLNAFSMAQQNRLIHLYLGKRMRFGYPGDFITQQGRRILPFFFPRMIEVSFAADDFVKTPALQIEVRQAVEAAS